MDEQYFSTKSWASTVDDPHCSWIPYNSTHYVVQYSGSLARFDTPYKACSGVNLQALNFVFSTLAMAISAACLIFAIHALFRRRRTQYNILMTVTPFVMFLATIGDQIGNATYYQFWGKANAGHAAKFILFLMPTILVYMEGVRIDFVLVVLNRSRKITKKIQIVNLILGLILFIALIAMFAVDCSVSVLLIHLCYKQTVVLQRQEGVSAHEAQTFSRNCIIASALTIISDFFLAISYNFASSTGKSFGRLSTLGAPLQNASLLYSVYLLQRLNENRTRGPSGGDASSREKNGSTMKRTPVPAESGDKGTLT
ncbi:hypothetical protein BC832DRAFT_487395 [Gaertneriomyces semiglobifer]|nr:hypothetical protein BC832DRAFT_487395 [Gaertneriomyces semiglobifer]